jgi:hypothetical protein
LELGEEDLAEAGAWARREPAKVVGDLHQGDGDGLQGAAGENAGVFGGLGLEVVLGLVELHLRLLGDQLADFSGELWVRIDAGAHRGAADGKLQKAVERLSQTLNAVKDLGGIAAELLSERDGRGVL